jgi:hypothetical protein
MLAPKLVAVKSPIPQPLPHELCSPGALLAESTGDGRAQGRTCRRA